MAHIPKEILKDKAVIQAAVQAADEAIKNKGKIPKKRVGTMTESMVNKKIKKIKKKHKLYIRAKDDSLRRLDKIFSDIYDEIILLFLSGNGEQKYALMNKGVEHWLNLKAISMKLDKKYKDSFAELLKLTGQEKSVIVSYNSSWKPLVELTVKKR